MSEETWEKVANDAMISAYVPEANDLTREEALKLAAERDAQAAAALKASAEEAGLKPRKYPKMTVDEALKALGY